MEQRPQAYTVTAITRIIKATLEETFPAVWVEGEISNFLHHNSGHRYFSLKDERASLRITLWRSVGQTLKFDLKNGQKVMVFGDINVYEKRGEYQLNCRKVVPVGTGPLELAFRQLHEKLGKEGLFDEDRKKPIPDYAQKVGIVTSPTGAAIRDMIHVARRRNSSVQLYLFPAQVQGDGAERTIAEGIQYFNSRDDINLIIIGRGGGSLEDLWPFNEELSVRAIAASRIPIVSAVGHEIDFTLSDYAADLRAATPSAAAELAIWSRREAQALVADLTRRQATALIGLVRERRQMLDSITSRTVFARPLAMFEQHRGELHGMVRLLSAAGKNRFDKFSNRLSLSLSRLDSLSPLKTLQRGYSVTRLSADHRLVRKIEEVETGDEIESIVTNGRVTATVTATNPNKL